MKKTEIKIQVHNGKENHSAVYVLSRGKNSGKPLAKPCPNCYAIQAPPEILSEVRAVAQILFVSDNLKPLFRGSVIEFVTVKAYRKQFLALWFSVSPAVVSQAAQALADLECRQTVIQEQLVLLRQLRKAIAFAALK